MAKHGELTLNEVEAVVNKLGGIEAVRSFLRGELSVKALERKFELFKTLTLGLHKSPKDYRKALESAGFLIGDYASEILNKISVAKSKTEVDLVLATVAELGFKDGARRDAIYARALELGLELCPAEVGPALRLATKDSPWILVGMEPITDSVGFLDVFSVHPGGGGPWLSSDCGKYDNFWSSDNQCVFVQPRK